MRMDCKTAERFTVLKALEMSTETAVLEGTERCLWNHWRVVWMMASQPFGVFTPSCMGSRMVRARSEMSATATLLVMRRKVSPTIGRSVPLVLRSAIMDAPQTNGRTDSGTSPWRRRLTTSEMSRNRRSEEAGQVASRMWEGRRPDLPAPEVERKECTAFRTRSHIGYWGSPRRHLSQGLHACPIPGLRGGVKVAKGSHNVIRGADGKILKESKQPRPDGEPFLGGGWQPGR